VKSYRQWRNKRLVEQAAPLLNLYHEPVGNEAEELVVTSPFSKKVEDFHKKIAEMPRPSSKKGLGDLGMQQVGKTTFKAVNAGETPTISNGIPVG